MRPFLIRICPPLFFSILDPSPHTHQHETDNPLPATLLGASYIRVLIGLINKYAFYLAADDVYQRGGCFICFVAEDSAYEIRVMVTLIVTETLMSLCGFDKYEIVRILAGQLFMVVTMAKYGRMVESENHSPRQPPQPGCELVQA
ncbi:hypothetical protein Tco_1001603 [Tanacetum coccineum]